MTDRSDTAKSVDSDRGAGLDFGRVQYRADACRDTATQQANLTPAAPLSLIFGDRDLRQHRVLTECGRPHVVENLFAVLGKPRRVIRHQPLALGDADCLAKVGLARCAEIALAAFGRIQRNDVVTRLEVGNPRANFLDDQRHPRDPSTAGKIPSGSSPDKCERVGVTNAGRDVADQDLAVFRAVEIDFLDFQGFACLPGNCGTRFHRSGFLCSYRLLLCPNIRTNGQGRSRAPWLSNTDCGKRVRHPARGRRNRRTMTLEELRNTLTSIDRQIVELIADRQNVVDDIGKHKHESGRATRDYEREKDVLDAAREHAGRVGVDPNLAEEILTSLIRASLTHQEKSRVEAEAAGDGRRALIIGGAGKMGGWFVDYFSSQGFLTVIADTGVKAGPVVVVTGARQAPTTMSSSSRRRWRPRGRSSGTSRN